MNSFQPVGEYLLLDPKEPLEKVGTIIIPDAAKKHMTQGVVLARGEGELAKYYPPGVEVIFQGNTEYRVSIDGESRILIHAENILMVRNKE